MKKNKIFSIIMTIGILFAMSNIVFAGGLIPDPTPEMPSDKMNDMIGEVLGWVEAAGVAVATGMLMYVGIKYTLASANEKANLKAASIKYVIGALILLSLSGTFALVEKIMEQLKGEL